MKNASCHDDKMEAYCNVVRALEDKFYGIELNHVPRRYNEVADELAKSRRGESLFPQMFLRETLPSHPSTSSRPPRARRNPQGLPRTQQARSLWTRTPQTKRWTLPTRGVRHGRGRSLDTEPVPRGGGLAGQIHRLDGSRGTPLGPI
jgi:hypothetical protein